ncbi:hypothetical protein CK203_013818 [Vitis vinifera]|uniref:Uncharacterized protein n=1 Tax=Vitis vinifera TaxID=29760 RepID=A0A438JJ61_VITVI|nr:hypothetical protein CK203_013818 [Vitis vinifera]
MAVVKGGHVSLAKLAEEWILRSSKIFQIPFSRDAYVNALKETEQFLWAGSEMDAVSFKIFTGYAEEAMILVQEIDSALSTSSKSSIPELEQLYSRACEVPIYVKEMEKLMARISALKVYNF